jgi:hypothetical protein
MHRANFPSAGKFFWELFPAVREKVRDGKVDHITLLNPSGNARRAIAILGRVEPSNSSTRIGYAGPPLPHWPLEANTALEEDSADSTKE